jgi:hypothetical protein
VPGKEVRPYLQVRPTLLSLPPSIECRGSLPPVVNLHRSCVGLGWLAQETTGFRLVRASEE